MFQKGNQIAKGNKHTEEWKEKAKKRMIGNTNGFQKGVHPKNEWKKGYTPWNKNKKGLQIVWNKGKKCPQLGLKLKGRKRLDMIGNTFGFKRGHTINIGKQHTKKTKRKIRESVIKNPNRIFKDTSIELKIEEELKKRNINYRKQISLCKIAIVDFYLPEYRIVIQCDGDYWHNRLGSKERDETQDKVLVFNGFNVYRFWEHEINKSIKGCVDKLFI